MAKKGAVIIVHKNLPIDIPGLGQLEEKRQTFEDLIQQLNFTEIENGDIKQAKIDFGMVLLGGDLDLLLETAKVRRESMADHGLQCIRRTDEEHQIYFVVNNTDAPVDGWVSLQTSDQSAALFDPMTGEKGMAAVRKSGMQSEVYLQLAPNASCILKTTHPE